MNPGKMRPLVPVPKRPTGFSIDSIMGREPTGDRSSTPSDTSDQGDETHRSPNSPMEAHGLMGFGSRLPPLHPALPAHVQQLLLSDPSGRVNQELLNLRSQAWAFGNPHLGTLSALGSATMGAGVNIGHHPMQGLHQSSPMLTSGLLHSHREHMMMYPWVVARQGASLMGTPYGTHDGSFFFHPYRKPKRIRTAFSPTQLLRLEQSFEKNHYVVGQERKDLASKLNLTETQVTACPKHRRFQCSHNATDRRKIRILTGRERIRQAARQVKDGSIVVSKQFPREIIERRRKLIPAMLKARKEGKEAFIRVDKPFTISVSIETKFTSSLSPDVVFRDVQMRDDPMRPDFLTSLIDDMITYIDKRFQNFNEVPLSTFRALGLPDGAK